MFARRFGRWADDDDRQELRLIVWDALHDHDPELSNWRTFLASRVKHRMIDRVRTRDGRRGQRWHVSHPYGSDRIVDSVVPDFADTVALGVLLEQLPAREREALVETYVVGRTCTDLAVEWGVSEQRVGQIRTRAARRLADWMRR